MAKRKHPASGLMSGVSEAVPHPATEPIHKNLARGAFAKHAEKYRNGEMGDAEFHGHIKQAHSRLQDPVPSMGMPMSFPTKTAKEKTHSRKQGKKHV